MKSLIVGGLSLLIFTAASTQDVRAEKVVINSANLNTHSSTSSSKLTPFDLVEQARHGSFKAQGIPGYQPLKNAYFGGELTAKQLVAAAVEANQLSPNYLNDPSYINAVDTELRTELNVY